MLTSRTLTATLALMLATPAALASITYHTVDVPSAIGFTGTFEDGFIYGDGADTDLSGFGVAPEFANPNGSLSYTYSYGLPFGQFDVAHFLSATSSWDRFVVTGQSVDVRDFALEGSVVQTNGAFFDVANAAGYGHSITATFDGRMQGSWTAESTYTGPFAPWVGGKTQVDWVAAGGYVLNDASTGLQTASAAQFAHLGAGADQVTADYLNFVVDNHLPDSWTQAGLWLFAGEYTAENTRGFFEEALIGGSFIGYNAWYSTDTFVFGKPLVDEDGDGLFSPEEVAALIDGGLFPDLAGLNLAGEGFAQLFDISVIGGDGTVQTIVFEYDETVLMPREEARLAIVHFTNGVWETPDQVLDIFANTITVTLGSFSPFALVSTPIPLPAAAYLFGGALVVLGGWRRRHSG